MADGVQQQVQRPMADRISVEKDLFQRELWSFGERLLQDVRGMFRAHEAVMADLIEPMLHRAPYFDPNFSQGAVIGKQRFSNMPSRTNCGSCIPGFGFPQLMLPSSNGHRSNGYATNGYGGSSLRGTAMGQNGYLEEEEQPDPAMLSCGKVAKETQTFFDSVIASEHPQVRREGGEPQPCNGDGADKQFYIQKDQDIFEEQVSPGRCSLLVGEQQPSGDGRKLDEEFYDVKNYYKTKGCIQAIARSDKFEKITLAVISINAVYIGVDADNNDADTLLQAAWPYQMCDHLFAIFFTAELLIRFLAFEHKRNCCRDAWFVFDSFLVAMMVAETWILTLFLALSSGGGSGPNLPTGPLRLLRLLRLSRLVRLLRAMPELLTLVMGIKAAVRAVMSSLMLILLVNYVFAIMFNMFLSECELENIKPHFGTLGNCMWTLMMDGTFMDGTKDILQGMREMSGQPDGKGGTYDWHLPWLCIGIFLMYVLLTAVTVMNMLIGVLCEVVSTVQKQEDENRAIDVMQRQLRDMLIELDKDGNGQISKDELQQVVQHDNAKEVLLQLNVNPQYVMDLTEALFEDDKAAGRVQEVTREELMEVILKIRGARELSMSDLVEVQVDLRRLVHRRIDECVELIEKTYRKLANEEPPPHSHHHHHHRH